MEVKKIEIRVLRYKNVEYRKYGIAKCGTLFIRFKRGWKRKNIHPRGDHVGYNVTNPLTKKPKWIQRHRATLETFDPISNGKLVACHNHGTKKSDGSIDSCTWKTEQGNRNDRIKDGTHSTGHNTAPGKLKHFIDDILRLFDQNWSKRALAKEFGCSRAAIINRLKQHGRE